MTDDSRDSDRAIVIDFGDNDDAAVDDDDDVAIEGVEVGTNFESTIIMFIRRGGDGIDGTIASTICTTGGRIVVMDDDDDDDREKLRGRKVRHLLRRSMFVTLRAFSCAHRGWLMISIHRPSPRKWHICRSSVSSSGDHRKRGRVCDSVSVRGADFLSTVFAMC